MPKAPKPPVPDIDLAPAAPAIPSPRVDKSRVRVFNNRGDYVREYSIADHGKGFVDLAKEYAGKVKGRYEFPILL